MQSKNQSPYNTPQDKIRSVQTTSLPYSVTATTFMLFLEEARHSFISGPFHCSFPLAKTLFLKSLFKCHLLNEVTSLFHTVNAIPHLQHSQHTSPCSICFPFLQLLSSSNKLYDLLIYYACLTC